MKPAYVSHDRKNLDNDAAVTTIFIWNYAANILTSRHPKCSLLCTAMLLYAGVALLPAYAMAGSQLPGNECADSEAIRFRGFTTRLENDLFANTDHGYTNGVSVTAISNDIPAEIDPKCLPWPVQLHSALLRRYDPKYWQDGGNVARAQNVVVKFGQSMYTPVDRKRTDLITGDRPYAGLLYVGLSWNRRRLNPQTKVETLDTREITLGMIGPLSLAHQAQDLVHGMRGIEKFQGWQNQLGNEPALQLAREQKYRDYSGPSKQIPGFSSDTIRVFGLRLGNIETSASYGVEGRIGWNLPNDFGSYPIRPGAENRPPATPAAHTEGGLVRTASSIRTGAHLFASLEGRFVAYDFTLDGNLLRDSHSVTRRPLVGQAAFGFSVQGPLAGHGAKLAVMRVIRSREFEEQGSHPIFGSVALSIEF